MIDPNRDQLLRLAEVAKLPAFRNGRKGRPTHKATVWRWITRGVRAPDGTLVRLESIRLPGGRHSSVEAVDRFIGALNPQQRTSAAIATTATPLVNKLSAAKFLDAVGICDTSRAGKNIRGSKF